MVTIYTERGPAGETLREDRPFNFGRLAAVSLGAALLLSMIAAFNLNSDVKNLTASKMTYVQDRIAAAPVVQR